MNWIEGFKQDYNSCVLERLVLVNMDKVVGNEQIRSCGKKSMKNGQQ